MNNLDRIAKLIGPVAAGVAISQAMPILAKYAPDIERELRREIQERVDTDTALLSLQAVSGLPDGEIVKTVEHYQDKLRMDTLPTIELLYRYYAEHGEFPDDP